MYKVIPSLFAVLLLFGSVEAMAEQKVVLTPLQIHLMKTQPLEMGNTVVERGTKVFNERIDRDYPKHPAERRPYITERQMGMLLDGIIKKYRRGDKAEALGVVNLLESDLSSDERVELLDTMIQAYLNSFPAGSEPPTYSRKLRR